MLKSVIKLLIILIISMLIGNMAYGIYKEMQISDGPSNDIENHIEIENVINNVTEEDTVKEEIEQEFNEYKVSSKLIIPNIDLETYVLETDDEEAMWLCPTKFFGPEPNEKGNYCIAAHNYNKDNMFNHIIELEIGDKITLIDNKNGRIEYEIYDIYKVKPSDTTVLSQETNGRTEITLITCSDYSSKRIIVKARRV